MKSLKIKLIHAMVANAWIWRMLELIVVRLASNLRFHRTWATLGVYEALDRLSEDLIVKHGPFRGMLYPDRKAIGSSYAPKILGCYERELHPIIERITNTQYSTVIDVGCAEGYYAVGLALKIPDAKVYAFDTDPQARAQCDKMAAINGVGDRLVIGAMFTATELSVFDFGKKGLILCDSEGYEKQLFTCNAVANLHGHDALIELHDHVDPEISALICQRFEKTHDIMRVESIDDYKKSRTYHYDELSGYGQELKRVLLGEFRNAIMEWYFLTPKP